MNHTKYDLFDICHIGRRNKNKKSFETYCNIHNIKHSAMENMSTWCKWHMQTLWKQISGAVGHIPGLSLLLVVLLLLRRLYSVCVCARLCVSICVKVCRLGRSRVTSPMVHRFHSHTSADSLGQAFWKLRMSNNGGICHCKLKLPRH